MRVEHLAETILLDGVREGFPPFEAQPEEWGRPHSHSLRRLGKPSIAVEPSRVFLPLSPVVSFTGDN